MALTIVADESTELGRLVRLTGTENPSKENRAALHAYLDKHGLEELAKIGDLGQRLTASLISQAFSSSYSLTMAIAAHVAEQREELGYEKASPLERQLIDHLLLCWVRLQQNEALRTAAEQREMTFAHFEHTDKRLTAAQRRYLRAVETLAKVRRLLYKPENNVAFNILLRQQLGSK